jgi:hypothetical protein
MNKTAANGCGVTLEEDETGRRRCDGALGGLCSDCQALARPDCTYGRGGACCDIHGPFEGTHCPKRGQ